MKKIIGLFLFLLFIVGCSYNGNFEKGFHVPDKPLTNKINLSAALVNTQELKDYRIQEYTGGFTYTFYINPAFNEELVNELRNVFSKVQMIETTRELDKFDVQVIPILNYEYIEGTAWNAQYRYRFSIVWDIKDAKSNMSIEKFKDARDVIISPTVGTTLLSILTGLSLFTLAPITIPLGENLGTPY